MTYTYEGISLEICKRCSDPNGTSYLDRAKEYFVDSIIATLSDTDKYDYEEIPSLITETTTVFNSASSVGELSILDVFPYPVIKILSIISTPSNTNYKKLQKVDWNEWSEILSNQMKQPGSKDLFWLYNGNNIRYISMTALSNYSVIITAIKNPDEAYFGDNDLRALGFGSRIIRLSIELATSMLKKEIGLE